MIQYKYILYMCIISYLFFPIVEEQCDWRVDNGFCKYVFIVLSTIFVCLLDFVRFSFRSARNVNCSCAAIVHFKYWFYSIVLSIGFTVLLSYAFWKFWSLGLFALVNAPTWKIWAMKGVKWAIILWIAFDVVLSLGFLVIWLLV